MSSQTQFPTLINVQSHLVASDHQYSSAVNGDHLVNESNLLNICDDQMWLQESENDGDPWKNVKLTPLFPYPVAEDHSSFMVVNR